MQIYVVRQGDNVDEIAALFGIPVERLTWDNQIEPPYPLAVGQALLIREEADLTGEMSETIGGVGNYGPYFPLDTGGYAYPYIDEKILTETLPYLTELQVFSYGFTEEGNLILPQEDVNQMIKAALSWGTRPMLVLTPLGEDGHFNNALISQLVNNTDIQQKLIRELWEELQDKQYGGVDLDFEYILAKDRVGYAAFVMRVRKTLNFYGYKVTVALAPKTSKSQKGLLYEAMDYKLLGKAANQVLLMTYEWGYTYGPPMAIAPIDQVRRVVEYAVTEIPKEKINLGIPNYGYDWPLPYQRGTTKAQSIGSKEAVRIAIMNGAKIQFDATSQSPYFYYWKYGIQHVVWFEDVRSIAAKFELVKEFKLNGVGYWQIMTLFRANWLLAESEFLIQKQVITEKL
ncbi:MAG: glycosyl hydrolase family 18 protein [Clostridium sp.]